MKDIRSQNNTYRWLTLNKAFKWTENAIFKFQKALNQTEIKTLIDDFHNSLPSDNIDSIGTKLTNILNSVGKISLRDGPLFFIGGLPFLGLADNFFQRVMRFKQFFSLHFVMKTIFLQPFLKMLQAFYRSYLKKKTLLVHAYT